MHNTSFLDVNNKCVQIKMCLFIPTVWHACMFLIKYINGWRAYCMQKYHLELET